MDWLTKKINEAVENKKLSRASYANFSDNKNEEINFLLLLDEKTISRIKNETWKIVNSKQDRINADFDKEIEKIKNYLLKAYLNDEWKDKSIIKFSFEKMQVSCENNIISLFSTYTKLVKNYKLITKKDRVVKINKIEKINHFLKPNILKAA